MFYEGWSALLRARVMSLETPVSPRDSSVLVTQCERLAEVLDEPDPYVDSYPGMAWPADSAAGAAALAECGRIIDPEYLTVARRWLDRAVIIADPETGLLPHAADRPGVRGSSSALVTVLVRHIDSAEADRMSAQLLGAFETRIFGLLPAIREYPRGVSGRGDVDSGPVLLGVSAPASVVGIGAALVGGDEETAGALRATTELFGVPAAWGGHRRYAIGRLAVGDAFLAWASSAPGPGGSSGVRWRARWAGWSLGALALGVLGFVALWRTR